MQPQRGHEPGAIPLLADRSWLPAGALLTAHLAHSAFGDRELVTSVLFGLIATVLFFFTVVLHALGHLVVARLIKGRPYDARLYVFGDVPRAPTDDLAVALAGPAVSAVTGAAVLFGASMSSGVLADILRTTAAGSLGLAAVNLAPGLPLDAGHVIASLSGKQRIAVFTGRVLGVAAMVAGTWLLLSSPGIIEDTAFGLWLVLAGIFILKEARATPEPPPQPPDIQGQTVEAWARPFVGRLDADDLAPTEGGPFAVSEDGRLAGVLAHGRYEEGTRTGDVMVPWTAGLGIRADAPLSQAISRLADGSTPVVVVVDERGVVRGVLDEQAVRARVASV